MIDLNYRCSLNQWISNKSKFRTSFVGHKEANIQVRKYYAKAVYLVNHFNEEGLDFSNKGLFKRLFWNIKQDNQDIASEKTIYVYLNEYIERLETNKQFYRKDDFKTLRNKLFGSQRALPFFNKNMTFNKLNVGHLRNWVAHLRSQGINGGIRNYMIDFRKLYNAARQEDVFQMKKYPFELINFGAFKSEYNPKGLTVEELKLFLAFEINKYPELRISYYTFLLAYFGAGVRFSDLCKLRYSKNLIGNKILYRASRTKKMMPPIEMDDNIRFVLEQLKTDSDFIVPFLNEKHETEKQQYYRSTKCNKQYNSDLEKIRSLIGIKNKITSHVARHSVAIVLSTMGATLREIQSVYNHQRSETTRHYLQSLGFNEISRIHKKLSRINL